MAAQSSLEMKLLTVMHTPGHTPGSICLLGEKLVFTGDTLFAEGIGRTDFPGGSMRTCGFLCKSLRRLPDYFLIYPGHGPTSIIGEEKRSNPFLVGNDVFDLGVDCLVMLNSCSALSRLMMFG